MRGRGRGSQSANLFDLIGERIEARVVHIQECLEQLLCRLRRLRLGLGLRLGFRLDRGQQRRLALCLAIVLAHCTARLARWRRRGRCPVRRARRRHARRRGVHCGRRVAAAGCKRARQAGPELRIPQLGLVEMREAHVAHVVLGVKDLVE